MLEGGLDSTSGLGFMCDPHDWLLNLPHSSVGWAGPPVVEHHAVVMR